jgi:hypothetical protein
MIANLQKGLRFVYRGREVIGEGTGFGVPVLLYLKDTYFSGSSRLLISGGRNARTIRKEYIMDRVQRKEVRGVKLEDPIIRTVWRYFDRLYQKHKRLQSISSTGLLGKLGVHFIFEYAKPVGRVITTYSVRQDHVKVRVDFSLLRRDGLKKAFILNEQGCKFFRRYSSSEGTELGKRDVGSWEIIGAQSACITDERGRVGFRLWRIRDSALHVGRERVKDVADWIGLDYEVGPDKNAFEYNIQILGAGKSRGE